MIEQAKEIIGRQQEMLAGIVSQHYSYGVVLEMSHRMSIPDKPSDKDYLPSIEHKEDTCVILHGGQKIEVVYTKEQQKRMKLKSGDTVKCVITKHGVGIVEKESKPVSFGPTVSIKTIVDKHHAEVENDGRVRLVLLGLHSAIEEGSKAVLDETGSIVMKDLGKPKAQYTFSGDTGVSWDDIGGLDGVKHEFSEAIEKPILYKDLFAAYGRKQPKGILLFGPPGNGKTMLGKAVATSVAKLYNSKEPGFIYIKGPEILNMYVGASEERIRNIFSTAREFKAKTGCPAIIFIDEAEAILSKRGSSKGSDMDKTIVPQFLAEMDGLEEASAIVILTTNRPDMLDSAIVREGRIDKKIRVPRPDEVSVNAIFKINLKKAPCSIDRDKMAAAATKIIFDESLCLYEVSLKSGRTMKFCLQHIVNGAMITAMVNDAISSAINRDIAAGKTEPTGITMEDLHSSIMEVFAQNSRMNHEQHFQDLAYELMTESNDEIKEIKPVKVKINEKPDDNKLREKPHKGATEVVHGGPAATV